MKSIKLNIVLVFMISFVGACGDAGEDSVTSASAPKSIKLDANFNQDCATAVKTGNTIKVTFKNFEARAIPGQQIVNCNASKIIVPIPEGTQVRIAKASSKGIVEAEKGQDSRRIKVESFGLGARGKFTNLFEDVPSAVVGAVDQDHRGSDTVFSTCGDNQGAIRLNTQLTSTHGSGGDFAAPMVVKLNTVTYELESKSCP